MFNFDALPTLSTETLYGLCLEAMEAGRLNEARAIADEMCRSERAGSYAQTLGRAVDFEALRGYSDEILEPLQDRIDQYNSYAG